MNCYVQILHIEDGRATVELAEGSQSNDSGQYNPDSLFDLPVAVLPENSRAGDILQLQVSFCPYQTLSSLG
jgi:hypothetical protein